jgi:hypothetical protein
MKACKRVGWGTVVCREATPEGSQPRSGWWTDKNHFRPARDGGNYQKYFSSYSTPCLFSSVTIFLLEAFVRYCPVWFSNVPCGTNSVTIRLPATPWLAAFRLSLRDEWFTATQNKIIAASTKMFSTEQLGCSILFAE